LARPRTEWRTRTGLELGVTKYDFASQFMGGGSVLDVACGSGVGAVYLFSKGVRTVHGGDISTDCVRRAVRLARGACSFSVLDACSLPFRDGTFDLVVSIETIEHLSDQEQFLAECHRVLKLGGRLVCSTPNREIFSPSGDKSWFPGHIRELTTSEFRHILEDYFHEVTMYGLPSKDRFGLFDRLVRRWQPLMEALLLSWFPMRALTKLLARTLFPRFQLVPLDEVDPSHLDEYLTDKYTPFALADHTPDPMHIIAVARKAERDRRLRHGE